MIFPEALALQARTGFSPHLEIVTTERVPDIALLPPWHVNPTIDEASLRALWPAGFQLDAAMIEVYTKIGNGFRYAGYAFPSIQDLIRRWERIRAGDPKNPWSQTKGVLVPIQGDDLYFNWLVLISKRCEIWASRFEAERPRKSFASVTAWLDKVVGRELATLRAAAAERDALEPQLVALQGPPLQIYRTIAAAVKFPILWPLRHDKLHDLATRAGELDAEWAASLISHILTTRCFDQTAALGERTKHLFDEGNDAANFFTQVALALMQLDRVEAIQYIEASMRSGGKRHVCDIAWTHVRTGELAKAEPLLAECPHEENGYCLRIRGDVLTVAGKYAEAETAYKRGLEHYGFMHHLLALAKLYLVANRLDDAAVALLEGLGPTNASVPTYFLLLAELFDRTGEPALAATARSRIDKLRAMPTVCTKGRSARTGAIVDF